MVDFDEIPNKKTAFDPPLLPPRAVILSEAQRSRTEAKSNQSEVEPKRSRTEVQRRRVIGISRGGLRSG